MAAGREAVKEEVLGEKEWARGGGASAVRESGGFRYGFFVATMGGILNYNLSCRCIQTRREELKKKERIETKERKNKN